MDNNGLTRRALGGVAVAGVAVPVLAACGADTGDNADPTTPSSSVPPTEAASEPESSESASSEAGTEAPQGLVAAEDIPVGGGVVLAEEKLVITQPSAGTFKGFDATCTHQQCLVTAVTTTMDCPCHGSKFSIEDGSVAGGPAPSELSSVTLKVDGDQISRG